MDHLHARHEAHSPTYNEWLDTKVPYIGPKMEAKDLTMHVLAQSPCEDPKNLWLLLIWTSLYDLECNEVLKLVVTSSMSPKNVA